MPCTQPETQADISVEMLTYAMTVGNYITKLASTMKSLLRGRHRPKLREREVDSSVQAAQVGGLRSVKHLP